MTTKNTSAISSYTLNLFHGSNGTIIDHLSFIINDITSIFFHYLTIDSHFYSLIIFIFLFLATYQIRGSKKNKASHNNDHFSLPPGPKPWPIVGNLPEMLMNKPAFRWVHKLMNDMNTDIICIRLGNVHVIAVTCPQIGCEFLKKQDAVFLSRPVCMAADYISDGYLTTVVIPFGEQWKKMKRVVTSELLSPGRYKWLHNKRAEEADHLVRYIYNQCKNSITETGGVVDVRKVAKHYCGNVIRKMIFSKRFFGEGMPDGGPGREEEEQVDACFTIHEYLYSFCVSDFISCFRLRVDVDGHEKMIKKAVAMARKNQDLEIDERIRQWRNGTKKVEEDLLDVLIMLKDANGNPLLSAKEIKAQILEIMLATVDNPSNAVEWALAEMLNQPEIFQKAREELDRVVGKERLVQESDLSQLNYVKACAREAFRLHPVAPFNVPHVSMSDTNVAGYFIPKGSYILLSRPGLGRNPKVWEEPLRFKPERHLKNEGSEVQISELDFNLISFSAGRRGCPAITLGSTIVTMLLARMLQGFTWSMRPNVTSIDLSESVNGLFKAEPLLALAKPRLEQDLYPET